MVTGQNFVSAETIGETENPLDEEIINKYNVDENYLDLVAKAKLAVISTEKTQSNEKNGIETEKLKKSNNNTLDVSNKVKVEKHVLLEDEISLGK